MYVATEVATREHVAAVLEGGIDLLWIGARTSANPFAVQEIADALQVFGADIPVLVKNPVSPDLELWIGAIERLRNAGLSRLGAIHRGFTSAEKSVYRNLPMWSVPIELHRRMPQLPLFCDPSHIGGRRDAVAPLAQQAMDLGFDGLIVEAHAYPDAAWSDKEQQVTPLELAEICRRLVVREGAETTESLDSLRGEIDKLDDCLLDLLARRMHVARDIGRYKRSMRCTSCRRRATRRCWRGGWRRLRSWAWMAGLCGACCRPCTKNPFANRWKNSTNDRRGWQLCQPRLSLMVLGSVRRYSSRNFNVRSVAEDPP